jgi:hypothetical protein
MSHHNEYGIFRSFGDLNYQNLLYLQAELIHLELELKEIVRKDKFSGDPVRSIQARHWPLLKDSQQDGHDEQFRKVMQIRAALKEYSVCQPPRINS